MIGIFVSIIFFVYCEVKKYLMRAIIAEDEALAVEELISSLKIVAPYIEIVATVQTVAEAVCVIESTAHDLIFMDVHLGDGNSFDIFKKIEVLAPVIFITAYDSYSLKAFQNQGIDYLLKPFSESELGRAISKLSLLSHTLDGAAVGQYAEDSGDSAVDDNRIQERFLVNIGAKMRSVSVDEIAYFMADGKYLHIFTFDGGNYILDQTITGVVKRLSPALFFQINRKFIISFKAIKEMFRHSNNRIKVLLSPELEDGAESVVSAERVVEFRKWLNR